MREVIAFLNNQQIFSLFIIISIGYFLGKIKVKGFSFESSAILFVAMFAGHLGIKLPSSIKILGLLFFIYSIGLQAGPRFFSFFKKEGKILNLFAFLIVTSGALATIFAIIFLHINHKIAIGLFAGALTSTPGLAAAQEATGSNLTSVGYGIAYPFGVIGVILFIKVLPYFVKYKEKRNETENEKANIKFQHNIVKNPAIFGKTLRELSFRTMTGCVISRIKRGESTFIPKPSTKLLKGDIVRVVGTENNLKNATNFLGGISKQPIDKGENITVKRFVVTNKETIGKTIREIALNSYLDATITRIRRSGIEFPAMLNHKLEWGDRITVVGEKKVMNKIKEIFGDDIKALEEGNIYSVILGMVIGIMLGMIPVSIGNILSIKIGITGGILLSGLILSNIGKTGPIIWRAPGPIIHLVRELGLVFFLAVVGVNAGSSFLTIIKSKGISLLMAGAIITVSPLIFSTIFNKLITRFSQSKLGGILAGGMTSTPGLSAAIGNSKSEEPLIYYASVYPVAMISMIIWAKILATFFK